jgi:hypothetical protein
MVSFGAESVMMVGDGIRGEVQVVAARGERGQKTWIQTRHNKWSHFEHLCFKGGEVERRMERLVTMRLK